MSDYDKRIARLQIKAMATVTDGEGKAARTREAAKLREARKKNVRRLSARDETDEIIAPYLDGDES